MALDYSKLSDDELDAIANDDYSRLSDATLQAIANEPQAKPAPEVGGAAPQFYPTGTGVNMAPVKEGFQTAGKVIQPGVQAATQLVKGYGNLGKLTTDVAMSALGLPPPVAASSALEGIKGTYSNVQDYLNKSGQFAPKTPINPIQVNPASPVGQATVGGPAAQQGSTFIQRMAQQFAPIAAKVAPVLNTAGRVAGPAGLAYNAYQGAEFAQQAELGPRLAQGQGQQAQQAFRNMNTQFGAPITREQAITVLQSGNERDIAAFGGRQRLMQLAQ